MKSVKLDTIFALASAPGRSGVSVMRVSGPLSDDIIWNLTEKPLPRPRRAVVRELFGKNRLKIDEAILVWFSAPRSFTGEDVVEFHTHGSPAVIEALSGRLFELGARQAEPGEFSKRAFQNGKMDLTEAEGLADLIDANTEGQRSQAMRQMQGGLKEVYEGWREQIIEALANVEGEIDFPDEEDVPDSLATRAGPVLKKLRADLDKALEDSGRGESVRHGLDIAIIGAPNAGKSSIINALANRNAAIVSAIPGTTRDIVEVHLELAGLPVRLSDTAGLRETTDEIEAEGVRRARLRSKDADLRLAVVDASDCANADVISETRNGDFVVLNKTDLGAPSSTLKKNVSRETFLVSAKTGNGIEALVSALEEIVRNRFGATEQAGLTRARHRDCVERARESVGSAIDALSKGPELAGTDLRLALHAIKELAGETDIEAVLDKVFSSFCIGK